jgi:hypothetical protein
MTYDLARQRTVLFGGLISGNDTWEWDGTNWTQRALASGPSRRSGHGMVYDLARLRVLLFGGVDGATGASLADTWEWDGNNWNQRAPAQSPGPRFGHAMANDLSRVRTVLFGGTGPGGAPLGDTWEWDGNNWVQRAPTSSPSVGHHAMVYDMARGRGVLFAGPSRTWLFGNHAPALAQVLGNACPGSNGPPLLTSNESYLGNSVFQLHLLSARAASPALFALATAPDSLDLGGGCRLYVKGSIVPLVAVTNGFGFAESPALTIPLDLALRGALAYAQAIVADPLGPVSGLALSAGRKLVLGD